MGTLRLDQIDRARDNPRRKLREIPELADSIAAQGLLQPLVVIPAGTDGRYLLVAGHRRIAALERLGRKTASCVVLDPMDDAHRLTAMLTENDQRQPLTAMERAEAYRRLMDDHDLSQSQVARLVGRSPSAVNHALQLLKPPDQREREIDEYRLRRAAGVPQRGRPPVDASVAETMDVLRRASQRPDGGFLTTAQAAVALRVIEKGAFALARERARDERLAGVA